MKFIFLMILGLSCLNAELVRNDRFKIVDDTTLKLQWQDDKTSDALNYKESIKYCSNLALRGHSWRLPNKKELKSIVDKTNFYPSIASAFTQTNIQQSNSLYWSSTKYDGNKGAAWLVGFWGGGEHYAPMTYKANVRCVRKAK